ncbi:MAG: tRNA (guanosine(37)-N1)-methyltransferase TrmD [Pirellula sp.]|jgi:tRNA (guanine37-N1)-methyltransferase|nr:tRNA (guanosine(37)-N1)-methyltransferase TrmD [Pirellula sp.]
MFRVDIITLFPQIFAGYLTQSLLAKAIDKGLVEIHVHDLRDWSVDEKHHKVDDRPYGGGPGMLICVEPVIRCVEAVQSLDSRPALVILLTPQGERLEQRGVESLAQTGRLIVLCGRYEGFDQRVIDILKPHELSIGDYVLNGGEVAAMVLVDSTIRMIPGVLGDECSSWDDSFSRGNRLLEFPQYTRPPEYRGHRVPDVLVSGDHKKIAQWRQEQSLLKTELRRKDLLIPPADPNT